MIYKTCSIERVIAKVFTDLSLQEGDHRLSDMIEWAGEALEKIGAFPSFTNKVTGKDTVPLLELANYSAKLPCDFHNLIQISYASSTNGPFYPMRYSTGNFDNGDPTMVTSEAISNVAAMSDLIALVMNLDDTLVDDLPDADPWLSGYKKALAKINSDPVLKSKLVGILNLTSPNFRGEYGAMSTTTDFTYVITPGYIKTNVESGYLMMAYQAIPTDNKGYPMIPDDQGFIEAIYWYITMKIYYPQWVGGQIRDAVYYDARRSWNYYCKQAYGDALMPNTDLLESIKNSWLRLVPEINEHNSGFSTLGQAQAYYNHN